MRDDRLLPATRWSALVVTVVLVAAAVVLYGFPTRTGQLFAWPVRPPMTALSMGGGYLSGAVLFGRALHRGRWHDAAVGFLAASALTVLMLAATLLHWNKFSHHNFTFWVWLVVYIVTPVLLPALWRANRPRDPGGAGDVPRWLAIAVAGMGFVQFTISLTFFAWPSLAIRWWPWQLTPLTARALSAFMAYIGAVWLAFAVERRWSALQLHVESAALGIALVGVGALRSLGDLNRGPARTAVFVMLLTGSLTVFAVVEWVQSSVSRGRAGARIESWPAA